MYIYFKSYEEIKDVIHMGGAENRTPYFGSQIIHDYKTTPYVNVSDDADVVMASETLKKLFLKATIQIFPHISRNVYEKERREYGIYKFGKAKGELTAGSNCPYVFKIETTDWEGIADMRTLQERLFAGTISPSISYEKAQASSHLLQVLKELIQSRNLTWIQRFFLALRLTRPNDAS